MPLRLQSHSPYIQPVRNSGSSRDHPPASYSTPASLYNSPSTTPTQSPLPSPYIKPSSIRPLLPRSKSSTHLLHPHHHYSHSSIHALPPPLKLSIRLESPPLILYGKPSESTGTLLSGLFTLDILQATPVPLKSVHIAIVQQIRTVKSHSGTCKNCLDHVNELARWDVLTHSNKLPHGSHGYPFSHLIPGEVPATTSNAVYTVNYLLTAVAVPDNSNLPEHEKMADFVVNYPLIIRRSIIGGPERNSVRIFPPTDIVAHIVLPSAIYPGSSFPMEMVIEGVAICNHEESASRKSRWRLRKINWKIVEEAKIRSFRCPQHKHVPLDKYIIPAKQAKTSRGVSRTPRGSRTAPSPGGLFSSAAAALAGGAGFASPSASSSRAPSISTQSSAPGSANNSVPSSPYIGPLTDDPAAASATASPVIPAQEEYFIETTQTVAHGDMKSGWKTDFSGKGKIELAMDITTALDKVAFDIEDPFYGLFTSHLLVVEIVIAEETVLTKSNQTMPSGAARVLRMQFKLNMTDRSGLGIAWDDEVPPTYEDVPLSPPNYDKVSQLPAIETLTLGHDQDYVGGINNQH